MQALTKKTLIVSLLLFVLLSKGFSQEKVVTGRIHNKAGIGIAGASIQILPSKKTIVTDSLGGFSTNLKQGDNTVNITSLGFISQRFSISSNSLFDFTLEDDPKMLSDVVVTAYGIKKEAKKLGYTIQEIKGADLVKARDANPINSLAGKISGLSVGANAEMLGRPQIVLRGNTDVLFVVDGVPINSDTWNISPDDIESYSILKGPNAAALYGSRGLNGAIIITTKRGTKDKKGWSVDFNSSNTFEKGLLVDPKSQYEYGRGTTYKYSYGDRLYDNTQRLPEWGPHFEGQLIKQYDGAYDPATGIRTATPWTARGKDNFKNFLQTGFITTNNISASAATDKYDVRLSYSHLYQKGIFPNTKLNGDNLNINTGINLNSKLRVEGGINLNIQQSPNIPDVNYGPNSYMYMFKVYGSSDYDINDLKNIYKGPQGVQDLVQYAPEYGRENSAWFMAKKWLRSHDKTDIYGYVKAIYKINNSINISLRSQITTWNQMRSEKAPPSINLNAYVPWYYFGWNGDYREDKRSVKEYNTDLIGNYDHKFKSISVSALVGLSNRNFKYNSNFTTTKALAIPNLYNFSNSINPVLGYNFGSEMQTYSGFYSVDFGYKKFFNINHTGRVDNLSTLAKGKNTFFYPSVSVSSVLSDYTKIPKAISFFKVRASYADVKGALTSSIAPSAFMQLTGKDVNNGLLGYGNELYTSYDGPTYINSVGYSSASYYNGSASVDYSKTIVDPNIKPFDIKSYEAGVDMKFLKNRLGFDFTYFTNINGPNIFLLPVAASTTYENQIVNGVTTQKKGFEFSLSGTPVSNPTGFTWAVLANISTYRETLKTIYGDETILSQNGHRYKTGDRVDAIYGTTFVRDQSGNIVYTAAGYPQQAPTDISNKGLLGYANPDYSFGVSNKFSYHNFNFSFQFDGRLGGKIYDRVYYQSMNGGTAYESANGDFGTARLKEWQSTNNSTVTATPYYVGNGVVITSGTPIYSGGQITNLSALTFAPNTKAVTVQSYLSSGLGSNFDEYYMIDRSFVKLREVLLGYSLPAKYLKEKLIKAASFSLVGRNLLYFAKRKDMDVDQFAAGYNAADKSLSGSSANQGLSSVTGRRFGFNINLSF